MTKQWYYGPYGGQFVPEPLATELKHVDKAFEQYYNDPAFQQELMHYMQNYAGRPTPLTHLDNLSQHLWGAQIYLKREDMTNIGAHKINHTITQALLAKKMGKTELIAETGAGMHGTATATVGAMLDMKVKVFMGEEDTIRQKANVDRMRLLGAEVVAVKTGTRTLKDAVNEAIKYFMSRMDSAYYLLWSAVWPYPYPKIVRISQSIVGTEAKGQFTALTGKTHPDYALACVGGGCNSIGLFSAFIDNPNVELIGVEAGGRSIGTMGEHAARMTGVGWACGVFHGYKSYFLQYQEGNIAPTHSISSGLDYPGIGPEHAYLHDSGRVHYVSASDQEVIDAFLLLARKEWILAALESSHALAHAFKLAPTLSSDETLLVNLSGRGDKDLHTIFTYMEEHNMTV
jgi:tryptophan synthase beta chain